MGEESKKKICYYLDLNSDVIKWGCEIIEIPYTKVDYKTLKSSKHRYYPDFYYELKRPDGSISKVCMEVKPYKETIQPKAPIKATRRRLENFEYALKMWNQNLYKWEQAISYCKDKGIKFVILTEKQISRLKN